MCSMLRSFRNSLVHNQYVHAAIARSHASVRGSADWQSAERHPCFYLSVTFALSLT